MYILRPLFHSHGENFVFNPIDSSFTFNTICVGDDVFIGGAKILGSVKAGNGIVHVIDKVLLPPTEE